MDWLFTEMEEHSKKLQMYSDFYDYFERGLNVEKEFTDIMQYASASIPSLANHNEYLHMKRRVTQAAA
eukprot:CAMPEP_0170475382 /NCGR_PEP_ID=MMETSP0123-20130129/17046_1 /TAXON_ID=182087 /ORGANISM="Favella ehrenbergii, Strain Fehren 1" /LENGTH=67 /DNA_ID=CAMNT_0010745863 /DNA_START=78 /DNA_END=281 /DNA_ORIENTATION=-